MRTFEILYDQMMHPEYQSPEGFYSALKSRILLDNVITLGPKDEKLLRELANFGYNEYQNVLNENNIAGRVLRSSEFWHTVGHVVGIVDPSGLVGLAHSIVYFIKRQIIMGALTLLTAIPGLGSLFSGKLAVINPTITAATKAYRTATVGKKSIGIFSSRGAQMATQARETGKFVSFFSKHISTISNFFNKVWTSIKTSKMIPGFIKRFFTSTPTKKVLSALNRFIKWLSGKLMGKGIAGTVIKPAIWRRINPDDREYEAQKRIAQGLGLHTEPQSQQGPSGDLTSGLLRAAAARDTNN